MDEIVENDDPDVFRWNTLRVSFFAAAELVGSKDEAYFVIMDESKDNPGQSMTEDGIFVLSGMEERYAEHGLCFKKV
jgi:hypothetical protein